MTSQRPQPNSPALRFARWWHIWRVIELILLAAGFFLIGFYSVARAESLFSSRAALKHLGVAASPSQLLAHAAEGHTREPSTSNIPLAVLTIPKLGLTAPVLNGTDELTLNHALGLIAGTSPPGGRGNIGIAGHRDTFFRGLKDVKPGDRIELRTLKGTDVYVVDQIRVVRPNAVEVLRPRKTPSVTLVTCYPFYFIGSAPKRFIVTASLSS